MHSYDKANGVEENHIEQDLDTLVFDKTEVFLNLWKSTGS